MDLDRRVIQAWPAYRFSYVYHVNGDVLFYTIWPINTDEVWSIIIRQVLFRVMFIVYIEIVV